VEKGLLTDGAFEGQFIGVCLQMIMHRILADFYRVTVITDIVSVSILLIFIDHWSEYTRAGPA